LRLDLTDEKELAARSPFIIHRQSILSRLVRYKGTRPPGAHQQEKRTTKRANGDEITEALTEYTSAVRFPYPRKLELEPPGSCQRHPMPEISSGKLSLRMGVSILIRSWSPNLYRPAHVPTKTTRFAENSQRIAFDPPISRHLLR